MLDFLGTIVTATLMVLAVNALVIFLDISRRAKLMAATVGGVWIGLAAAAGAAGLIAIARPFPVVGIFVVTPLAVAAVVAAWPPGRAAMRSIPMPVMIGLNAGRVFAVFFLLLAADGRLGGPFPYFAAWGDIITAVAAVPVMWMAAMAETRWRSAIAAWNLFGAADLALAIFLGVTSAEGSPLQLFHAAPGSEAMQHLPWSFVPTMLVPFYLILHAIIWARLRQPSISR